MSLHRGSCLFSLVLYVQSSCQVHRPYVALECWDYPELEQTDCLHLVIVRIRAGYLCRVVTFLRFIWRLLDGYIRANRSSIVIEKSREQPKYASNFLLIPPHAQRPYRKVRPSRRLQESSLCGTYEPIGDKSALRIFEVLYGATRAMRSELVFAAERTLPNRYSLCRVVSLATRKFHRPNTRVEETTDAVLRRIANASAGKVELDHTEVQVTTLLVASDPAELRA